MRTSGIQDGARTEPPRDRSTRPGREAILLAAAEWLDPVLRALEFQPDAPGHWSGTRFVWHEDVLVEVVEPDSDDSPGAFDVEIFAGVPRRGIADPTPGWRFVDVLDAAARAVLLDGDRDGRRDGRGWMVVTDEADLRRWLAFVAEHLPGAIARARQDV